MPNRPRSIRGRMIIPAKTSPAKNAFMVKRKSRIAQFSWLKLDATHNQSWTEVNARLQAGGDLFGWRFATSGEVDALMGQFGASVSGLP